MSQSFKNIAARKFFFLIIAGLAMAGALYFSNKNKTEVIYEQLSMFTTMSTSAKIHLYSENEELLPSALYAVTAECAAVEKLCNIFNPESELSKLNQNAFDHPVECSPELWEILSEARRFYKLSEGAFDVSIAPLMRLWGFHRKAESIPTETDILETKRSVGLDKVIFDDEAKTVQFTVPGMMLDLGGIAKGWAADKAAAAVEKMGVRSGSINLGGDGLFLSVPPPGKELYSTGVRNPFSEDRDESFARSEMLGSAVTTSGNYERMVVIDGKTFSHIINPETGYPVENVISSTVITKRGVDSDALSTILFIRGADFAKQLSKEFPDLRYLILSIPDSDEPSAPLRVQNSKGFEILYVPEFPKK